MHGADLLVVANNHPAFSSIDLERTLMTMSDNGFVFDYWNNLADRPADILTGSYFTVGNLAGKF